MNNAFSQQDVRKILTTIKRTNDKNATKEIEM